MSYANGTTNYNLPQTVGTDKRDWSDTNTAFAAVDAALKTAVDGVTTDAAAITEIQTELNTPTTGIKARLTAVEDTNTSQGSAISTLQETVLLQGGAITNLETAVAATVKASAVADPYSDASTYAVGDVVMYQGVRYVCTTAIEVAEAFDASHWQAEDVQEALGDIIVDLNKVWPAFHRIDAGGAFTSSTDDAYTGYEVNIPAHSYFTVTGVCTNSNGVVDRMGLSRSHESYTELSSAKEGRNRVGTTYSGYTGNSALDVSIWAKYNNATSNSAYFSGFYITNPTL